MCTLSLSFYSIFHFGRDSIFKINLMAKNGGQIHGRHCKIRLSIRTVDKLVKMCWAIRFVYISHGKINLHTLSDHKNEKKKFTKKLSIGASVRNGWLFTVFFFYFFPMSANALKSMLKTSFASSSFRDNFVLNHKQARSSTCALNWSTIFKKRWKNPDVNTYIGKYDAIKCEINSSKWYNEIGRNPVNKLAERKKRVIHALHTTYEIFNIRVIGYVARPSSNSNIAF